MAITCNFEKDDQDTKRQDKVIVRIAPGQVIGSDSPELKPSRNGAYLWVMNPRRRPAKSWRETNSIN